MTPTLTGELPGLASLTPFPGRIYAPTWTGRYPHLMPLDRVIWDRFLSVYGADYLGFQYDVLVGDGATPLPNMSKRDRMLLYLLTVKRVDCLGIRAAGLTLFEVKPRLGMAAIGQCVSYVDLWRRQYGKFPPVRAAWVGEQSEPDLAYVADRQNMGVIVV